MKAKIKRKKEIAKGTLLVEFDTLGEKVNFISGQYFFVTLVNPPYTDAKGSIRHFTIVNPPEGKDILTMTTRLRDTAFKRSLKKMPIGADIKIGEINGNFVLPEDISRPLVFIAGGIGITPFISMLRHIKNNNLNYDITLIYANRNQESAAFLEELKEIDKENKNFKLILIMSDDVNWSGEKGRIDVNFIKEHLPEFKNKIYYISGPPAMVDSVLGVLLEAGIKDENIKKEKFSGY